MGQARSTLGALLLPLIIPTLAIVFFHIYDIRFREGVDRHRRRASAVTFFPRAAPLPSRSAPILRLAVHISKVSLSPKPETNTTYPGPTPTTKRTPSIFQDTFVSRYSRMCIYMIPGVCICADILIPLWPLAVNIFRVWALM